MIAPTQNAVNRQRLSLAVTDWKATLELFVNRVGNRTIGLRSVEVVWLDTSSIAELNSVDPRFEFRFLGAEEIRRFSTNPGLKLAQALADRIEAGRDFCFAALEGDKLAAYGWYALDCIEAEHNFGIPMSFHANTAYMYNGFTHPDYRGLRLHGRTMGLALRTLQAQGIMHLISTVDWKNEASLRSCDRLGYHRLGRIVTVGHTQPMVLRFPHQAVSLGIQFGHQARQRSG